MTDEARCATSRVSQRINAAPAAVYAAFTAAQVLLAWLPPAGMTAVMHAFDARVGGGYCMSLLYAPSERAFRGKTSDREDKIDVRFVELAPPRRLVETIEFVTAHPAFKGEMTLTVTLDPIPEGTEVTMTFDSLPPGLRPEDNDEGARLSLQQLARRFEPA